MKLRLLVLNLLLSTVAFAQSITTITRKSNFKPDENTIVKDSSGMRYPLAIWQKMVQSGDYTLRSESFKRKLGDTTQPKDVTFYLVKLSDQEKESMMLRMPKPAESKFFTTGEVIKPFSIKDINGKKITEKDWAGKTVVLNFWFIGCPPCRAEMPELNKIVEKYKNDPNVIFIGMALDGGWEVKDFIKTNPFNYQLVGDKYYADRFKIHLFPTNVVIDRSGKVQFHGSGFARNTPYWIAKTIAESEAEHAQLK